MEKKFGKLSFYVSALLLLVMAFNLAIPAQIARAATTTVQAFNITGGTTSASDNDYTRINNAIQAANSGDIINLQGTFDWTETNAAASWALGSDGQTGKTFSDDDYVILPPTNLNNITITASSLGVATIQGPGDLAGVNLEGVFQFYPTTNRLGGNNQDWTISNIRFLDFDNAIGFFFDTGDTSTSFNNTHITNNYIRIARDLNATVAPTDTLQNIGIHFSFGTNQVISGNTIDIQGDGVSDSGSSNFSTEVGMQSNTSGGAVYEGLQITNNIIHVLNQQNNANPESILGIWENGHAHTSNITVSGNQFINQAAGNDPAINLQRAFRVTSHSSSTTTVTYSDNMVSGANIGFQWIAGSNFATPPGNQPVLLTRNTIINGATGVLVQSQGLATLSFNRIVGNSVAGLTNVDGTLEAENNWWGCNAGPGNVGCDIVNGAVDYFDPWLQLNVSASPSTISSGGTSAITADMTHNSNGDDMSGSGTLPSTPVTFSATQGTMAPPSGTITTGQATSTFTSTTTSSGTGCAMVDNQLMCANVTVTASDSPPIITAGDNVNVSMSEDGSPTPFSLTLNATDADSGDTLTWSISSPATVGIASVSGTGPSKSISYNPPSGYNGPDSFDVQVSDGNGGIDTITVNVTIEPADDTSNLIWNQSYQIQYDTWLGVTNSGAFGGGYRKATSGNFIFKPASTFTQFKWITYRGPDQGKAQVIVDGVVKSTIDLYSSTAQWQYLVTISGLKNTKHTIVIKALNSKRPASSNKWVSVDGFKIGAKAYDDIKVYINNESFSYGSWLGLLNPGARFSAYRMSHVKNATMQFSFVCEEFTWVTARGPSYGKAQIYVDGVLKKTVDLYRASQQWQYRVAITGLPFGTHHVVIKVLGTKNPKSSGVDVISDGFEID